MLGATRPPNQMAVLVLLIQDYAKRRRDYNRGQGLQYYMVRSSLLLGIGDEYSLYNIWEKTFSFAPFAPVASTTAVASTSAVASTTAVVKLGARPPLHSVYGCAPSIPSRLLFVLPEPN